MTHELVDLISRYGVALVFLSVLVEQIGLPVPAVPILVVAGSLAAVGQMGLPGILLAALAACVLSDVAWYLAGRYWGSRALRVLCWISLSPDSCVHQSELRFERWRGKVLVFAKFVPGLSLVAPPLVGALGLRWRAFLLFDCLGALLWAVLFIALGYVFAPQVDQLLLDLSSFGKVAVAVVVVAIALYIGFRAWQRWRLRVLLRMPRITAEQLQQERANDNAPIVIDVRSETSRQLDPRYIRGALLACAERVGEAVRGIPHDRPLAIYCSCPNEATSARAVKTLRALGYHKARPLRGGLLAWEEAGYPVEKLLGSRSGSGTDRLKIDPEHTGHRTAEDP